MKKIFLLKKLLLGEKRKSFLSKKTFLLTKKTFSSSFVIDDTDIFRLFVVFLSLKTYYF